MTLIVGLTGGIGSGKTEVARRFVTRGIDVLDADDVAHALSRPGEAGYLGIVQRFGPRAVAPDATLDRAWLRARAFADAEFRAQLEGILHPLIRDEVANAIAQWRSPYGILVVPLLLEKGGLRDRVDRVLVVDCPEDEQVRRVMSRSGLPADEVRRIMAAQLPRAERLAQADDVIQNSGPPELLEAQVERLDRRYREIAARAAS
ncbi:MAG TPA: dephospho-CoA kinase [Casimicrobiaceae bacterium]|nr:dephospho-CoA kinase [Casimicrobiaceae bacterium]